MTWRYQPVSVERRDGRRVYSLAYVDYDDLKGLLNWSLADDQAALGESIPDLTACLARMLMDANLYQPVAFSSLKAGVVFDRVEG